MTLPDTGLPVERSVPDLRAALGAAGTAVLVAPPGSGKTTVVPLRLLDEPWLGGGRIVVLEPRRLATSAAARRMAALLGEEVGATVGYTTRDEHRVGPRTRVEVVTEGVLTRRLQADRRLPGTGLVVFDELHERNLQTDLGLALLLDARRTHRPDLGLLAMSATLPGPRVAAHLGDAPLVVSEAERHPVDLRFLPRRKEDRVVPATAVAVRRALHEAGGDVLVFLPGVGEIRAVERALADDPALAGVEVRCLYGRLPSGEQDDALRATASGTRRVVLSTDIAESSLTVEGVRVVVDSGLARVPRFDPRTGLTRLTTVAISRSSAEQRAGRAGRLGPGVAYRLWSQLEDAARRGHLEPEITKVDLAGLALELAAWGPAELRWLDPPPARTLREGRELLVDLGALGRDGRLTDLGQAMLPLPLHPRLARMVVGAAGQGQGALACALAVLVDERDVLRSREDVPADVEVRVALLTGQLEQHPALDRGALAAARSQLVDLARRAGVDAADLASVDPSQAGRVLALAYPDRVGRRRGGPGRFQLRQGTRAWLPAADLLAHAEALVVADLDGKRGESRIRLAAALTEDELEAVSA